MKSESDIRKRIQHHQDIIDHAKREIERIVTTGNFNDARTYWAIVAKEQAIINELLIVLEEKQ